MQTVYDLLALVPPLAWQITIPLVVVLAAGLALWMAIRGFRALGRLFRQHVAPRPAEDVLTVAAASIATGVSAQGMWRFSGDVLGFDGPLQLLLFAFIEIGIVTEAFRARRNMREKFSAGIDGVAVWALTCLTAVLSAMDARSVAEAVFRLAAPLVAAWLWERGMAVERHRLTGKSRIHWRLTPERVLVRLGLAEAQDRTAEEVDAQRRLTRVALAVDRARALREAGASPRRQRRALARMQRAYTAAHAHTGLGRDATVQQALAAEVASLRSADGLLDIAAASAWTTRDLPDFARLADETHQLKESVTAQAKARGAQDVLAELRAIEANVTMMTRDVTRHVTPAVTHPEVTNHVTDGVTDPPLFVPPGWAGMTSDVTPDVTSDVTSPRVIDIVSFDVNNPAVFDLEWPPPALPEMTSALTPAMTADDVSDEVMLKSKADVMRAYWESERAEGRYPRVADLARVADADTGQASRLRAELVDALPWREQRKAKAAAKKAVNGSPSN
jgi:hypothetical protein